MPLLTELLGTSPEIRLIEFIAPRHGIVYTEDELVQVMQVQPERGKRIITIALEHNLLTLFDTKQKKYRTRESGESRILTTIEQLIAVVQEGIHDDHSDT
jgi:hypothetical protein